MVPCMVFLLWRSWYSHRVAANVALSECPAGALLGIKPCLNCAPAGPEFGGRSRGARSAAVVLVAHRLEPGGRAEGDRQVGHRLRLIGVGAVPVLRAGRDARNIARRG